MKNLRLTITLSALVVFSGCGVEVGPPSIPVAGAMVGTAIGAGAGALIGDMRGMAGEGALIGAAAGLPIGLAIGAAYQSYERAKELRAYDSQISRNDAAIFEGDDQIEELRNELAKEPQSIELDDDAAEYIYVGPSLGSYYR